VSDYSVEMIRVRVLFLEPGNLIHPSELDDGITEFTIKEKRMIYGEDYADLNVYKINSAAMAESIRMGDELHCEIISTPNDPCVEMLVPMAVVFFDIMAVNSDWNGMGGGIGFTVESIGLWETFGDDYSTLVEHAKTLLGSKSVHRDEWGTKVQFMAAYEYSSSTDYWGEWDSKHALLGFFNLSDIKIRKFGPPRREHSDVLDVLNQVTSSV
jgi:hypothetical protein